ncbi:hypothetical protein BHE74_00028865 [Ensete ventricosum]|nr:hypothetical protein BHE74_00028865 [Ensete ventricosum]RZR88621.1 hypothetical protein BHM03_00016267 [Ensete ventricosum]
MELQQDDEPISSLSIGPGFVRCSEILSEFARRFVEGIRKLTGNMSIDCQKKIIGLTARMPEAARMAGRRLYHRTQDFERLSATEPPGWAAELPVLRNLGTFGG